MTKPKGKLIVFEGLDKAGKETQSEMLADYLNQKKIPTALRPYPTYESPSGQCIRRYLAGLEYFSQKTINMIYSVNRYETRNWINYLLGTGTTVILDRYYYSNMAYGSDEDNSMENIMEMDKEMPQPDLVIYIDILPETSMKRSGKDPDINERDLKLLLKAYNNYEEIKSMHIAPIVPIPGFCSIERLHKDIVRIVEHNLFKKK